MGFYSHIVQQSTPINSASLNGNFEVNHVRPPKISISVM